MSLLTEVFLLAAIALAGFVDSIAGGGGLISLPAYALAGLPVKMATANNKFGNFFGTAYASYKFAREKKVVWTTVFSSFPASFLGSAIGAEILLLFKEKTVSLCLLILLPLAASVMLFGTGRIHGDGHDMPKGKKLVIISFIIGLFCGIYDGFFGPGTGTFLVLAFSSFLKMDYVKATGTAKLINISSNAGALIVFLCSGSVDISLGIKCAAASVCGSFAGSRLAIKKGAVIIKPFIIMVIGAITLKLLGDLIF